MVWSVKCSLCAGFKKVSGFRGVCVFLKVGVFKSSFDSLFLLPRSRKAFLKCCFKSAVYTLREKEKKGHCFALVQGTSHTAVIAEYTEYNSSCCRYWGLLIQILLQEWQEQAWQLYFSGCGKGEDQSVMQWESNHMRKTEKYWVEKREWERRGWKTTTAEILVPEAV